MANVEDPVKYVEAVQLAKELGITPAELHAYFPHLTTLEDMDDEDTTVSHISGDMLQVPEEYEDEGLGFK